MSDRLYQLLPAIYRLRDAAEGEPLRALLAVVEEEFNLLETDIDRLYDNWFIETCDEWVVAYLGDLLGVRGLAAIKDGGAFSQRALVANTIGYRRRKGTAAVLEQLARDVTAWPAKAVEFFERLITTQYANHIRLHNLATVSLRDANRLELTSSPFSTASRTAEVRHIDNGRGRFNIPNVGLFLWRLQSYPVTRGTARAVANPADGRYTFDPLGLHITVPGDPEPNAAPLFNRPVTETDITQLAAEMNVPVPLRRRPLYDELNTRRAALVAGNTPARTYFDRQPARQDEEPQSVLEVFVQQTVNDPLRELRPEEILICHLGDWRRPVSQTFTKPDNSTFKTEVAVDPVLGRLAFPDGVTPFRVEVSYAYGFAGDLGGGPYNRQTSVARWLDKINRPVTWQIGVTQDKQTHDSAAESAKLVTTLNAAITQWKQHVAANPDAFGVIAVMDSSSYAENLTGANAIEIPAGSKLAIVAADWPQQNLKRLTGVLKPDDLRPHLQGNLAVRGTAPADSVAPGELIVDGLLVEGSLTVMAGNLGRLLLAHSTLAPDSGGLTVTSSDQAGQQNDRLTIGLYRSISGALATGATIQSLRVEDSIVDAGTDVAIVAPAVEIQTSTILGTTQVQSVEASNSIFLGRMVAERRQTGCVRFCYLPINSLAPRRHRCQPETAATASRVVPQFTSVIYGEPGYGQLTATCPSEIANGADDEAEMGAFHFLQQARRMQNLRSSLDEYLRFGLEAGIFLVN